MSKYSKQMAKFGHRIWRSKIIEYVTAIIPCHPDKLIFGGFVILICIDFEVDWRVKRTNKMVVHISHHIGLCKPMW